MYHVLAIVSDASTTITPTMVALLEAHYIDEDGNLKDAGNLAVKSVLYLLRRCGVNENHLSTQALPEWPREVFFGLDPNNPNHQTAAMIVMVSIFGRKWRQARAQWVPGRCAKTGRAYWWHRATRQAMWKRPDEARLIAEGFDPHVFALLKGFISPH